MVIAIALQAGIAAQVGMRLGGRLSESFRETAERLAAVALVGLGGFLLIAQLIRR